jgi:hypothetical protein
MEERLSVLNVVTLGKQNKRVIFVVLNVKDILVVLRNEEIINVFNAWTVYD